MGRSCKGRRRWLLDASIHHGCHRVIHIGAKLLNRLDVAWQLLRTTSKPAWILTIYVRARLLNFLFLDHTASCGFLRDLIASLNLAILQMWGSWTLTFLICQFDLLTGLASKHMLIWIGGVAIRSHWCVSQNRVSWPRLQRSVDCIHWLELGRATNWLHSLFMSWAAHRWVVLHSVQNDISSLLIDISRSTRLGQDSEF